MKRNCSDRPVHQISQKFNLLCKAAGVAGIILLMIMVTPPTVPAGTYDLSGSIEAAKQEEARLRAEAAAADERMHARSKQLYDILTDPNGKYKLSRDQAIDLLKSKGFLVDKL